MKEEIKISGIIPIYKESGISSLDVSRKLKSKYSFKKIGHLGTLDPMAEGVLPIMINDATKLSNLLEENKKIYSTVMKFGVKTDSDDITGNIIKEKKDFILEKEKLQKVISLFKGEIEQTPPSYSAVKINGKRAYKLAREGKDFSIPKKTVNIHSIKLKRFFSPYAELEIECSKGTYVRSIIRDIGEKLDIPSTMTKLVRQFSSSISMQRCVSLDEALADVKKNIIPISSLLKLPLINLNQLEYKLVSNGQIPFNININTHTQLFFENKLIAVIYKDVNGDKRFYKVFNN